jgi:putative hydrolase of the HAD superfamily
MISDIVFDIGRVLVDFSFDEFRAFLTQQGARVRDTAEFIEKSALNSYETGAISSAEFLNGVNGLLRHPVAISDLGARWQNIFTPVDQMLALAGELRQRYRVFLLSNTSELHWNYLRDTLKLKDCCDGALTSFGARAMKPDPQIFMRAETEFGLSPATTVFVDDLVDNIQAARNRGWHGIHHRGYESTVSALETLGITRK